VFLEIVLSLLTGIFVGIVGTILALLILVLLWDDNPNEKRTRRRIVRVDTEDSIRFLVTDVTYH
jgi:hypothetical protein